jgi:hypothetical protein
LVWISRLSVRWHLPLRLLHQRWSQPGEKTMNLQLHYSKDLRKGRWPLVNGCFCLQILLIKRPVLFSQGNLGVGHFNSYFREETPKNRKHGHLRSTTYFLAFLPISFCKGSSTERDFCKPT